MARLLDATHLGEHEIKHSLLEHVDRHGPTDLYRGHVLLAAVLAQRIPESTDNVPTSDPEHVEPLDLVTVVLTRLQKDFPDLPGDVSPTVAGVLTGGLLGEDVLAWADVHVPQPSRDEALGLVYLVSCLGSLHDAISRPGAAHEILTAVFASPDNA